MVVMLLGCGSQPSNSSGANTPKYEVVAQGLQEPRILAIDGDELFFIDMLNAGSVYRLNLLSGEQVTLVDQAGASRLFTDTTDLYYTKLIGGSNGSVQVFRLPKWGGTPVVFVDSNPGEGTILGIVNGEFLWRDTAAVGGGTVLYAKAVSGAEAIRTVRSWTAAAEPVPYEFCMRVVGQQGLAWCDQSGGIWVASAPDAEPQLLQTGKLYQTLDVLPDQRIVAMSPVVDNTTTKLLDLTLDIVTPSGQLASSTPVGLGRLYPFAATSYGEVFSLDTVVNAASGAAEPLGWQTPTMSLFEQYALAAKGDTLYVGGFSGSLNDGVIIRAKIPIK